MNRETRVRLRFWLSGLIAGLSVLPALDGAWIGFGMFIASSFIFMYPLSPNQHRPVSDPSEGE